jgi:hypothetical protein
VLGRYKRQAATPLHHLELSLIIEAERIMKFYTIVRDINGVVTRKIGEISFDPDKQEIILKNEEGMMSSFIIKGECSFIDEADKIARTLPIWFEKKLSTQKLKLVNYGEVRVMIAGCTFKMNSHQEDFKSIVKTFIEGHIENIYFEDENEKNQIEKEYDIDSFKIWNKKINYITNESNEEKIKPSLKLKGSLVDDYNAIYRLSVKYMSWTENNKDSIKKKLEITGTDENNQAKIELLASLAAFKYFRQFDTKDIGQQEVLLGNIKRIIEEHPGLNLTLDDVMRYIKNDGFFIQKKITGHLHDSLQNLLSSEDYSQRFHDCLNSLCNNSLKKLESNPEGKLIESIEEFLSENVQELESKGNQQKSQI